MSAWDGFFNDMDMAIHRSNFQQTINNYEARLDKEYDDAAELLGEVAALQTQLERYDPANPLIEDVTLIPKIKRAAVDAYREGGRSSWKTPINVGRTFRIPGHEGPDKALAKALAAAKLLEEQLAVTKQELEKARSQSAIWAKSYAGTYAVQQVFFHALEQLVPDHPLLMNAKLRDAFNSVGIDIFIKNGCDINVVFYAIQAEGKKPGHSWIDAEHTMQPEHRDAFRLAVHRRACVALRANPSLVSEPRRVLAVWIAQGAGDGKVTAFLQRWSELLGLNQNDPKALERLCILLCEDSPAGCERRMGSPIIFVLSQPELRALREETKRLSP